MNDGIDEAYFDFTYINVNAIEEIWVLPNLRMPLTEQEENDYANKKRKEYVEEWEKQLAYMEAIERDREIDNMFTYLNRMTKVCNWL